MKITIAPARPTCLRAIGEAAHATPFTGTSASGIKIVAQVLVLSVYGHHLQAGKSSWPVLSQYFQLPVTLEPTPHVVSDGPRQYRLWRGQSRDGKRVLAGIQWVDVTDAADRAALVSEFHDHFPGAEVCPSASPHWQGKKGLLETLYSTAGKDGAP